jgi:Ni/Co efflux regulator RcnB
MRKALVLALLLALLASIAGDAATASAAATGKPGKHQTHAKKKKHKKKAKKKKRKKRKQHKSVSKPKLKPPPPTPPPPPVEKLFHLTAAGTWEHEIDSRLGPVRTLGATTLRWEGTGTVAVSTAGRARPLSFDATLVRHNDDRTYYYEVPRPNGTWASCADGKSERLARTAPLKGVLVGTKPGLIGPKFEDADVAILRDVSTNGDPSCLPPFGAGEDALHVYGRDINWLPPVEGDWDFSCTRQGSFAVGWKTDCELGHPGTTGRWSFTVELTP